MILDDHSRMIVGGKLYYQENAANFQKTLKEAIAAYGIPNKLYVDNGSPYSNDQLSFICGSVGTVLLHTPVRDGASKGKVERNFRTLKERWLYGLDVSQIQGLKEFNRLLSEYIRRHNTTKHGSTGQSPLERYMATNGRIRRPQSREWLEGFPIFPDIWQVTGVCLPHAAEVFFLISFPVLHGCIFRTLKSIMLDIALDGGNGHRCRKCSLLHQFLPDLGGIQPIRNGFC